MSNTLELIDEGGAPRIRVTPPYVIGDDGQRYDADLSVKGCAYDTNPTAPWGRQPVAPGASECTVEVAWSGRGVSYPAVVDPSWVTTKSMSVARYAHIAELLPTGKVLVAGGYSGSSYLPGAELYDSTTDTWSATGSLNFARYEHKAVLLESGKVLIVGGYGSSGDIGFGELYDPQTGTWSLTNGVLAWPRHQHSVALLHDGRVLITGGSGSSSYLRGSEIYSPTTNSFSLTGNLNTGRYRATAVTLHDGRVLVGWLWRRRLSRQCRNLRSRQRKLQQRGLVLRRARVPHDDLARVRQSPRLRRRRPQRPDPLSRPLRPCDQ